MTSKLTREETQQIIDAADAVITALAGTNDEVHKDDNGKMIGLWDDLNDRYAPPVVVRELARMALAAMDSEPVAWMHSNNDIGIPAITVSQKIGHYWMAEFENVQPLYRHAQPAKGLELAGWQFKSVNGDWLGLIGEHGKNQAVREGCEVREVFAMADGVNERDQVRSEHAEWSQATFGNVGPVGPLKHLSKEAQEAAAEPDDLSEWADMQFLLWDAQRRAGITDEQITLAMIEKLAVNKQREWPEPKDGEPRLHIKEQPEPVVQENSDPRDAFEAAFPMPKHAQRCGDGYAVTSYGAWTAYEFVKKWEGWNACRAAMLQSRCSTKAAPALDSPPKTAEARSGNSPVIPEGWTGNDKANAALMMLDRIETIDSVDDDRIDGIKRIVRELAAATTGIPIISDTWIPVGERMPEDEQEVLTRNRMGHRFVSFFDKHSGLFFDRIDAPAACSIEHVLVTHWMPLPAAPQEVPDGQR